jgi:hypothetical protein
MDATRWHPVLVCLNQHPDARESSPALDQEKTREQKSSRQGARELREEKALGYALPRWLTLPYRPTTSYARRNHALLTRPDLHRSQNLTEQNTTYVDHKNNTGCPLEEKIHRSSKTCADK